MYTITFYSFKGGVGRTMALVNVGLSLAKSGRSVLLVDFDLEAPGLDTFHLLRHREPAGGLIDFVTDYRLTKAAPDIRNYVYQPDVPGLKGKVWVMPSGRQDRDYGHRLHGIDWARLYAEEQGYLLFEDAKQQWASELRADYVLIDSRTGHTDVGGICTRQLPDAVCLLFFPNEQNRRGLEVVLRDIHREAAESSRPIHTYLVASNVPYVDDEDRILSQRLAEIRRTVGRPPDTTIHHYDSLALLEQVVFTIQRPETRLAKEYRQLARVVTRENLQDKDVVSGFLEDHGRQAFGRLEWEAIGRRLGEIKSRYWSDGAILHAVAQANRMLGRSEDADQILERAEQLGYPTVENLVKKVSEAYGAGEVKAARDLVRRALEPSAYRSVALSPLLVLVTGSDREFLPDALRLLALKGIDADDAVYIASQLEMSREAFPAVETFLKHVSAEDDLARERTRGQLSLVLIGQRKFCEAKETILDGGSKSPQDLDIQDSFNLAVAMWGEEQKIPRELFTQVIALDQRKPMTNPDGNYVQCLAISNWAAGRIEAARDLARQCRSKLNESRPQFSAWRYLRVTSQGFLQDIQAMYSMIDSGEGKPAIILGELD